MIIWNHQWLWKSYPQRNDPHFCARCGRELEKVRRVEILESGNELRLELNKIYHIEDRPGRAKYRWTEFQCPNCTMRYSIDTLRKLEEEK